MGRLIDLFRPVQTILPEVQAPGKKVGLLEKLMWTMAALGVYLVCSQLPLYGIGMAKNSDPFYIMRMILASSRGTLMELGISPIITSGMIMQLLQGAKIIDVDTRIHEDRALFNTANKALGFLITLGEALAYVLSGQYGDVRDLGAVTAILLVVQLTFAGVIVLVLDDLLSKGYGLGSGINLFIVTNICESFFWRCFSPTTFNVGKGTEFEGAIVATVHSTLFRPNKWRALTDALFRENLPNLTNVAATLLVFLVVIYLQGFKINITLKTRGQQRQYPIKLFYTSNMPIILLSALVGNLYFFSQVLATRYPNNLLFKLLGRWSDPGAGPSRPVGGLAYFISPPANFADVVADPIHALIYIAFMLGACAVFARTWVEISGTGPRQFLEQQKENGWEEVRVPRPFKSVYQIIPTAAAFGGMCVAALSVGADLLGAIGSGTGILMAVTIIYDLYESFATAAIEDVKVHPERRRLLSRFVDLERKTD